MKNAPQTRSILYPEPSKQKMFDSLLNEKCSSNEEHFVPGAVKTKNV